MNMAKPSQPRRPRALIVEDEILIALGLEADLNELGFDACGLAANARQALSFAMEDMPDLAVVDVYLDGVRDGIETAKTLRDFCGVPIVFVTAYGHEQGIIERIQRQVPGAPILSKPLYGSRLAEAIAEVVKIAPSRRAQRAAAYLHAPAVH
jgi:DNA-binding NarL/FixJ family response regulator